MQIIVASYVYLEDNSFEQSKLIDDPKEKFLQTQDFLARLLCEGSVDFIYDSNTDHDLYLTNERFHHTNSRNPICLFISFNGPKITFY